MLRLEKLETRTQEITLLVAGIAALSVFLGGVFYLFMNPLNLHTITGTTGTHWLTHLFNLFGFASFYPAISLLYIGHYIGEHVQEPKDLRNLWSRILAQTVLQFVGLLIIASTLTVFQTYFDIDAMKSLHYGAGGLTGITIGGNLYERFGLYGAVTILTSFSLITGILSGIIQLVSIIYWINDKSKILKSHFISKSAWMFDRIFECLGVDASPFQKAFYRLFGHTLGVENPPEANKKHQMAASIPKEHPQFNGHSIILAPKKSHPINGNLALKEELEEKAIPFSEKIESSSEKNDHSDEEPIRIVPYRKKYSKPDTALLARGQKPKTLSKREIKERCQNLEERLKSFQVYGKIITAHVGIRLTMYEFQPSAGVKLSKITGLTDDLALLLGASSIRVLTPIPGKTTVGIEVPNEETTALAFSDLAKGIIQESKSKALPIAIGKDVYGNVIVEDIAKMPHLLVSGTTGSGKSVFINTLINSLLLTRSPKELRLLMIDPKMIELTPYNGIPHLLKPVVTDLDEAKNLLVWAEAEMDRRYQQFADLGSRNITSFNEKIKSTKQASAERKAGKKFDWEWSEMPYIVVLVDELADLMITQGKDVEIPITRIAQKARAAGVHLVLATQRPSSDIVTGLIKTNFPTRISFKVSSGIDSRTILDASGAQKLLGNGDMLYLPNGKALQRIQASFISEDEVKKIVRSISK